MIEKTSVVTEQNRSSVPGLFLRRIRSLMPWIASDKKENSAVLTEGGADNSPHPDYSGCLLVIDKLRQSWPDQAEDLFRVDNVCWHSDQHIWLQGANGSGKTTLMRLISGLEPVQAGNIVFAGLSDAVEQRVCYLHQSPYLFAGSVERNLNFVIRSLNVNQRPAARDALELGLKLAGLDRLRNQDAVTLSGGERQRLALLRAWILQPALLLLDEPAANLDDDSVALMHRLVTDLIEKGTFIMVSSHQQNQLTDLCNTRWSIHSGTLSASEI